jgi:hypothetical protein
MVVGDGELVTILVTIGSVEFAAFSSISVATLFGASRMKMKKKARRAPKTKIKTPIMLSDQERFMAHWGLIQWTQGVIDQSERTKVAHDRLAEKGFGGDRDPLLDLHC